MSHDDDVFIEHINLFGEFQAGLTQLLIDKGIITQEEVADVRLKMRARIDQAQARMMDMVSREINRERDL